MSTKHVLPAILAITALISSGCSTQVTPTSISTSAPTTTSVVRSTATTTETTPALPEPKPVLPEPTLSPAPDVILDLTRLISQDQLFAYLKNLTGLQPYSGWRNSATQGEAEALDYVAGALGEFDHLKSLGLELERQDFRVYLATEIWESRLYLTIDGQESEVPANAISGHRKLIEQALYFDSDGRLNDADRDPLEVTGKPLLLRSAEEVTSLDTDEARGKIVLLHFSAIKPAGAGQALSAWDISELTEKGITALVLVTEKGHGKYAGDGTYLGEIAQSETIPLLYLRLEDLAPLGLDSWDLLAQIEDVRLVWDTDVFSPGQSGNLVARIPGANSSRAVILGAHIDSANTPGAGDNALNCAVLLEVARVLDEGAVHPPVDIYLVWFGSHELGFYGSQHFVNTHQELLDRALGAFLMDGFTADQPGPTILAIQEASHALFGETQLPFADFLSQKGNDIQIPIEMVVGSDIFASDDGPFYGYLPAVRFAFGSNSIGQAFHSPYDTLESVQDQGDMMEQSVSMALITAMELPGEAQELRVAPKPESRALVIATHTEALHMTPSMLQQLDRALAWQGFDVDVIPYGQSPSAEDLEQAGLVLVLPVIDYPGAESDLAPYDEAWSGGEIDLLVNYVESGGLLVLTNSARRLFFEEIFDDNEDWEKINPLAAPFGVRYEGEPFSKTMARVTGDYPLTEDLSYIFMKRNNGLPISLQAGQTLAEVGEQVALALVEYGEAGGQVLVMSDLGMLDLYDFGRSEIDNFDFLLNLARYARER